MMIMMMMMVLPMLSYLIDLFVVKKLFDYSLNNIACVFSMLLEMKTRNTLFVYNIVYPIYVHLDLLLIRNRS